MLGRLVDKLFFATLLLIALQIPILADHYRQFISGKVDTLQTQVDAYQAQATKHGFASVDAMLSALLDNESALVREDARFKTEQIKLLMQTREGLHVLTHGHYFEKAVYLFRPDQFTTLQKVSENFSPAIPINPQDIVFSVLLALLVNIFCLFPMWLIGKKRRSLNGAGDYA